MIKLKNILSEGYAWERRADGSLPTLKDVQEAYDAKGVEEAEDKADKDYDGDGEVESGSEEYLGSRDKAIKAANKKAEQNPKDGKPKEDLPSKDLAIHQMKEEETESESDHAADEAGTDMDVLNMGSLEESAFWGRVKGNLHGHEYILREAFKK